MLRLRGCFAIIFFYSTFSQLHGKVNRLSDELNRDVRQSRNLAIFLRVSLGGNSKCLRAAVANQAESDVFIELSSKFMYGAFGFG
jgi:hypothetical protein